MPEPTPEVARLLELFAASGSPPLHELGVEGARTATSRSARSLQGPKVDVARVLDLVVPGPADDLPVRVYHPSPGTRPRLLVHVHGGGWVTGDLDVVDGPCRRLAVGTGCVVASVGYRRSPETPFPGPLDDVEAAVRWLAEAAVELGASSAPPVLLGDSAGANLVLATAMRLGDAGGPTPGGLVVLYPPVAPVDADRYPSHAVHADSPVLPSSTMAWFWQQYVGDDRSDPQAHPLLATSFAGLPPTLVVTAELDVLHDEGVALAERLDADGVATTHLDLAGTTHGFLWMDRLLPDAQDVVEVVAGFVRGTA